MRTRRDELRDYRGTFMLNHELMKEEADLLQGRISKRVSVRHYWSPAIKKRRDRVFRALELPEPELA